MSAVSVVRVQEPRTLINQTRSAVVLSGPKEVSFQPNVSTSYSTSSIQHSIVPPQPSMVDRRLYLHWRVQLAFTGSGSGNLLQIGLNDAFRAFPISQCIETASCQINGQQVSMNLMDSISSLLR